jgi:hypothetical protein
MRAHVLLAPELFANLRDARTGLLHMNCLGCGRLGSNKVVRHVVVAQLVAISLNVHNASAGQPQLMDKTHV